MPALDSPARTAAHSFSGVRRWRIDLDYVVVVVLSAVAVVAAGLSLRAGAVTTLSFREGAAWQTANVLAPLVVIAALIERAVEVVVGALREPGAREIALDREGDRAGEAAARLGRYKAATMKIAFTLAFALALLIGMSGVNAISQFVSLEGVNETQKLVLRWVDATVTALMLAGGADGIHRVVTTITAFLDATKQRAADG